MTERLSDMRETVLDRVCMTLAGRAAEEVRSCDICYQYLVLIVLSACEFACL